MQRRHFIETALAGGAVLHNAPFGLAAPATDLEGVFHNPPPEAGLSVVYHWTGGVVTREGITADMEGIAASGINTVNWFYFDGTGVSDGVQATACKTPEWWALVDHLMNEARRLKLTIAPHICSSWGPAGTEAITPELSQQMLVWSDLNIDGGKPFTAALPKPKRPATRSRGFGRGPTFPPAFAEYYKEVAVLAFPVPDGWGETSVTRKAKLTTNLPISDLAKVADPINEDRVVDTDKPGWLQFEFDRPFTLRSITMNHGGGAGNLMRGVPPTHYRIANSLEVQASDDGVIFRHVGQLEPMFNGWQTVLTPLTHSLPQASARFFRLVYHPGQPLGYDEGMRTGTRQGGGDYKHMVEPLGFANVVLSSTPSVHLLPAKNGTTFGRGRLVREGELPAAACINPASVVDLTSRLRPDGSIDSWTPPAGRWRVMRFGCMSQLSSTGGGLQADKYSAEAAKISFDGWFAEIRRHTPGAEKFVNVLNIDSWENGGQNWSPLLPAEFKKRRGYDLTKYLPCMAGVVVGSGAVTDGFLLDMRRTMSDCLVENFYGTLYRLAKAAGALVMSEAVLPAMDVDGLEPFKYSDWTGGEFWVRATQNWKPNDIADGVSGARIYGKRVVFAEAFTGGGWQDHPFALKAMGDHNYAEGINRMMLHVWNEQHHPTRIPGIPGAGTPFNHLNTWWRAAEPWRIYMKRTQALLQQGDPIEDALYYTGENLPCRSILAPGLDWCWAANPALPEGYRHTTINRDALLHLARVENGHIVVSGLRYRLIVLRAGEPYLTPQVAEKLRELVNAGAVVVGPKPLASPSLERGAAGQSAVREVARQLWGSIDGKTVTEHGYGKGKVYWGKPMAEILAALKLEPDVRFLNSRDAQGNALTFNPDAPNGNNPVLVGADRKGWGLNWCHRRAAGADIYFVTNQEYFVVETEVSFRVSGRVPELWNAETGVIEPATGWRIENGRTIVPIRFDPSGALFVVFRKPGTKAAALPPKSAETAVDLGGPWTVRFGSREVQLEAGSWAAQADEELRFFSGTAVYTKRFTLPAAKRAWLDLGDVGNLARVKLNGKDLGIAWKAPYTIEITPAAVAGENTLEIEVTNTWFNRLVGDSGLPPEKRSTHLATNAFDRTRISPSTPLLPAGLLGPVRIRQVRV